MKTNNRLSRIKSLLQVIAAGLMEYWKKWSGSLNLNVCRVTSNNDSKMKMKSIKLIEMSSALFVLGLGLTLATIAFILENIAWLLIHSKKNPVT